MTENGNRKERNMTFTCFSAIGILLVVVSHIDLTAFTVGNLYPYYSFQVGIFYFISGYFYKPEEQNQVGKYILRKVKTLLIPYFCWNLVYGVITSIFHNLGFSIGSNLSLSTLIVEPILHGHQFMYNFAAWFVPALFLLEVCNVIGRKMLVWLLSWCRNKVSPLQLNKITGFDNEYIIMLLYFIIGLVTVYLAKRGSVYDWYRLPARIMFAAPIFQIGRLYNRKIEERDKLPSRIYLPILLVIQYFIVKNSAGLAFSAVWVSGFANGIWMPYLTTVTGIAFWLRIAKIATPYFVKSRIAIFMGSNTFSIMMHHIFAFILLKGVFAYFYTNTSLCGDFDMVAFLGTTDYYYLPDGMRVFQWLYLIVGISLPLFVAWGMKWVVTFQAHTKHHAV